MQKPLRIQTFYGTDGPINRHGKEYSHVSATKKCFPGFQIKVNQVISYLSHPTFEEYFLKKYYMKIFRGPDAKIL